MEMAELLVAIYLVSTTAVAKCAAVAIILTP